MKKLKLLIYPIAACIMGGILGYIRYSVFSQYYDSYSGVLVSDGKSAIIAINGVAFAIAVILSLLAYRALKGNILNGKDFPKSNLAMIYIGAAILPYVAYDAVTMRNSGFFEISFAVAAILSFISLFVIVKRRDQVGKLLSCFNIIASVFVLLYIYKNNVKYPSISIFAFELLAMLFIMLGMYFVSASYFRQVKAEIPFAVTSLAAFFSVSSWVTDYFVSYNYLYDSVLPQYAFIYFVSAILVLCGFSTWIRAKESDKLTYYGWSAFTIESENKVLGIDCYFRRTAHTTYVSLDDFPKLDCYVLTHNHPEHSLDVKSFLTRDNPCFAAPKDYMEKNSDIKNACVLDDIYELEENGFAIKPFRWQHRDFSPQDVKADDEEMEAMSKVSCFGQIITTPSLKTIVNMSEGANPKLKESDVKAILKDCFEVDCLIVGCQLDFVPSVKMLCHILKPKVVVVYSPHEALFDALGVESLEICEFIKAVKEVCPKANVISADVLKKIDID